MYTQVARIFLPFIRIMVPQTSAHCQLKLYQENTRKQIWIVLQIYWNTRTNCLSGLINIFGPGTGPQTLLIFFLLLLLGGDAL